MGGWFWALVCTLGALALGLHFLDRWFDRREAEREEAREDLRWVDREVRRRTGDQ